MTAWAICYTLLAIGCVGMASFWLLKERHLPIPDGAWIFWFFGSGAALIAAVPAAFIASAIDDHRAHREFMTECLTERKQYECTALWSATQDHSQIVPMFIPIPTGR